jgi:hypothetical protein
MDKGAGASEARAPGRAALRLCNLVAQSSKAAEGGLQEEVEKELTGREEEPSELIYFKVYKSQIPVIEQGMIYQPLWREIARARRSRNRRVSRTRRVFSHPPHAC